MIENIKEFKGDVACKYNKVLSGNYPEGFVLNHAHTTREFLELNNIDEITILKATIIKYCETVSELIMTRTKNAKNKEQEDFKKCVSKFFKDCNHDWEDMFLPADDHLKHWIGRKCKKCKKVEYPLMYGY